MRVVKALYRTLKYVYGAMFALYMAAPAYAFTPSQVPLLSAAAVTPNVMLQVDNSGSMDTILLDAGFNPNLNWPAVFAVQSSCSRGNCTYSKGNQVANGTADYVFVGNLSRTGCTSGYGFYKNSSTVICLTLADPASGGTTRYPIDYLSYLVGQVNLGNSVASIPTESRIRTAISVAQSLVDANRSLRIGLATFNPPKSGDSGPGGNIEQVIVDLSPVTALGKRAAVTQADANKNYTDLSNAISALSAEANTPLAETYYQVTRYFRGLAPSPSYSGSPKTYTSPIQYRCQKNYGVVITDGLPTYDRTFPTDDPDDPKDLLPNWDQSKNDDGNDPKGDDEGDTLYLDDIAKFAYDIDMRKDTSTPALDLADKSWDTAGFKQQNMSTYTVGFTSSNLMLSVAASYGHGIYYQASDKASLNTALSGALSDINAKAGSGGGGAANSATLQTGTRFYQTLYDPTDWHGTVKAFDLGATGTLDTSNPAWSTDTKIISGAAAPILQSWSTAGSGSAITLDYVNFSPAQQTVLNANLPTGITGTDLIAWTKGTNKTGLRVRTRLLGDIINSPLVAALPGDQTASDLVGDTSYTAYLATKKSSMNSSLLVNANDGFVHVINPSDGTRRYAYMPSTVLPSLSTIASTTYGSGVHKFSVDGQLSVFDTQLTSGGAWQTVAVGGVGAGGKAYYAIQLFDAGGSNTIKALWEVKAPDTNTTGNLYNDLGYAYSKPAVAKLADGTGVMIIGNGYGSFTGLAALYVLNIKTGAVIREIPITPAAGETDNGLSSVRLRVNAQNVVQAAYAGDLKGHMWKFDLSNVSPASWGLAFGGKPLFTAPRGALQPITVQPLLLDHPTNGKIVYFGTGKFSETADKQTTDVQDFYAIWDADAGTGGYVESNLQPQLIASSFTGNGNQYFTTTENDVDWTVKKGWYLALSASGQYLGERIIYPAQTSRGRIIFTTAAVNSTDPCESTGIGRLFELDAIKGGMLNYAVLDTNGDSAVDTSDSRSSGVGFGSGLPNLASIVSGTSSAPDNKYVPDSSGNITVLIEKGGEANIYQRIMWRQIQ